MINGGNKFLEGHTADTGHRIDRGHSQCRYAHRHDAGGYMLWQTEHHEEAADSASKRLERSALRQYAAFGR